VILRAIFWIAVVAILMPHEPELGLGRPGTHDSLTSQVTSALKQPHACDGEEGTCFALFTVIDKVKANGYKGLARVKADIEEAQAERLAAR
jgi:hypothetical protein